MLQVFGREGNNWDLGCKGRTQRLRVPEMGSSESRTCCALHVAVGLATHVTELLGNALLGAALYWTGGYRDVFFALAAGVLLLPLVATHLTSALLLLRRRGDAMSCGQVALTAVVHVLQLGFIWRHLDLFRGKQLTLKNRDLAEVLLLRLTFTFLAGLPLLLLQLYLLLLQAELIWPWALQAALVTSTLSSVWAVASFRRGSDLLRSHDLMLSWPGCLFQLLWRAGEIASRIISLGLFARLYHEWVFLVLAFHWIVMLLCVSIPQAVADRRSGSSLARRAAVSVVTSYSYVFCYVNVCRARSAVWHTLYYVIMFLENGTLSIVWMTKSHAGNFVLGYLPVCISGLAFLSAMVCLSVYWKFFHEASKTHSTPGHDPNVDAAKEPPGCCRCGNCLATTSVCAKPLRKQRNGPFGAAWMRHCRASVCGGRWGKDTVPDSLLDCPSDRTITTGVLMTGTRLHQKLTATDEATDETDGQGCLQGNRSCRCRHAVAACVHRHREGNGKSEWPDSTSGLFAYGAGRNVGGGRENQGYEGTEETQRRALPAWLPAGDSLIAKHLLVDDWDQQQDKERRMRQEQDLQRCRMLLRQEAQWWQADSEGAPRAFLESHTLTPPITAAARGLEDTRGTDGCTCCCRECYHGGCEVSSILWTAEKAHPEEPPIQATRLGEEPDVLSENLSLTSRDVRESAPSGSKGTPARASSHQAQCESGQLHSVFIISHNHNNSNSDQAHGECENLRETEADTSGFYEESRSTNAKDNAQRKKKHWERRRARDVKKSPRTPGFLPSSETHGPRGDDASERGSIEATTNAHNNNNSSNNNNNNNNNKKKHPGAPQKTRRPHKSHWPNSDLCSESSAQSLSSEHVYENLWGCACAEGKRDAARSSAFKPCGAAPDCPQTSQSGCKDVPPEPRDSVTIPATQTQKRQQLKVHRRALARDDPATVCTTSTRSRGKERGVRVEEEVRACRSRTQEAWHAYSESEDSALPPETFSSSNDCCTASEVDSDGTPELVI